VIEQVQELYQLEEQNQ